MTFEWPSPIVVRLQRALAEALSVEERLQRTSHQQRLELLLGRLLGRVHDGRHRPAPYPGTATWTAVGGFRLDFPMRIALLILTLIALLIPAAAQASPRQVMTFEAPDELYDDTRRDATLDEIRSFGVTQIRQLVYWQQVAPGANRKRKPRFNASDPDVISGARAARPADQRGHGPRHQGHPHPDGTCPALGDEDQEGPPQPAEREAVRAVRHRPGAPLRRTGRDVVGLERAEPAAVPDAAVPQEAAGLAGDLPRPLPRRTPRDPQRARQPARQDPHRRDVAARQRERPAPPEVPARRHLPELEVQARPARARACPPTATPTTPTRRASARASSRPTRTT